jgi:hypothetical protein
MTMIATLVGCGRTNHKPELRFPRSVKQTTGDQLRGLVGQRVTLAIAENEGAVRPFEVRTFSCGSMACTTGRRRIPVAPLRWRGSRGAHWLPVFTADTPEKQRLECWSRLAHSTVATFETR